MISAWLSAGRTLVVAHRGAGVWAPENTLAAFRLAAEQGADAIEFDVRATADGALVVIHDAMLERTTDSRGEIATLTLEEVRRADAGGRGESAFRGERVPTLEEVLGIASGRLLVDIELKVPGVEAQVVATVARAGMTAQTLMSSFLEDALAATRAAAPGIALGLLQQMPEVSRLEDLRVQVYLPHVHALSDQAVTYCQSRGIRVIAWPVRTADDARAALGHRVDGLIADDPLLVRRMIENP